MKKTINLIKFSIIIPTYNSVKTIKETLCSVLNQTYNNYEVIIVDDGSTDNTLKIANKLKTDKINIIKAQHFGVGNARNIGINKSIGEYIIFLDSDDLLCNDALEILSKNVERFTILRFQQKLIFKDREINVKDNVGEISGNGIEILKVLILNKSVIDTVSGYAIKRNYIIDNNYYFDSKRFHEDFALMPYLIYKAKNIKIINNVLYEYVQTAESITRTNNYKKTRKKCYDMLYHYDMLIEKLNKENDSETLKLYRSYISNAVLLKIKCLNEIDKKNYKKELFNRNVIKYLITTTVAQKIKKFLFYLFIR